MGRRRRNDTDLIELIVKLGGLVVLLSFLDPSVRKFFSAMETVVVGLLALAVLALVVFWAYKAVKRRENATFTNQNYQEFVKTPTSFPRPTIPAIEPDDRALPANTLIEKLRTMDWFQFEKLVALVYEHQGYAVTRRGGANPDGGIDLIIEKDGLRSAVQCKQWKAWNVGVKVVREFLGALTDAQIPHGIFITLNGYTGDAKQLAGKHGIEIINETGLTEMLAGVNLQGDHRLVELLNDTRKFCPKCERLLVERVAGKGPNPGQPFWGCSGYPQCRFTLPMS